MCFILLPVVVVFSFSNNEVAYLCEVALYTGFPTVILVLVFGLQVNCALEQIPLKITMLATFIRL